ncbi:MAG: cache domain-containing protein, partial [Psychrobium sp.]|nr:cache domain-containing protein [Psychrobium sp.]
MNRIRNKLLLILTLGILLPMFSAEYYSLRNARISQHTEVMNQLESILEQKNQMITALFDREKQVLEIMATRPTVVNSLLTLSHQYEQGTTSAGFINNSAKLRPIFQELGTQQSLNNVYLVTKKGHVILALNNQHDFGSNIYTGVLNQSAFATIAQKVLRNGQPTYSKFTHYLGDNNQFSAFVAAPIKLGVETIGALIVQVYPSKLDSIINDYTALNRTGETILAKLKDEKAVFISPLRFYTPGSDNVEVTFNSRTDKPVQKAVQGLSGFGDSIDYRQQETLAVWRYLPQHNLGMVVKLDKEEAFHNIEASAAVVYWIALFVGLPVIVFA